MVKLRGVFKEKCDPPDGGTGSGEVQRAWGSGTRFLDDVEADHGGGDVGVAEEVLDGADVGSAFKEVCRE